MVMPRSRLSETIKSSIRFVPSGSRPSVGSSRMSSLGSLMSSSAMPSRCLMPRE